MRQQKETTPAEALKKLAALCARGEHSTGDADEKMRRWGLSEADRLQVIQKLVDNRFIDDERFARYFVHDKIKFNHWGRRKIEVALRQKGIADETIGDERAVKTIKWAVGRGFSLDLIRQCIDEAGEK